MISQILLEKISQKLSHWEKVVSFKNSCLIGFSDDKNLRLISRCSKF